RGENLQEKAARWAARASIDEQFADQFSTARSGFLDNPEGADEQHSLPRRSLLVGDIHRCGESCGRRENPWKFPVFRLSEPGEVPIERPRRRCYARPFVERGKGAGPEGGAGDRADRGVAVG